MYSPVVIQRSRNQSAVEQKALIACRGATIIAELEITPKGVHRSLSLQSNWEKEPGRFFDPWNDCYEIFLDEQPLPDDKYSYPDARKQLRRS